MNEEAIRERITKIDSIIEKGRKQREAIRILSEQIFFHTSLLEQIKEKNEIILILENSVTMLPEMIIRKPEIVTLIVEEINIVLQSLMDSLENVLKEPLYEKED